VIVGMLLFGTGEGLVMPNIHFITTGVEASSRGSVVALYTSAKGVGQTAGPPLGSGIYATHGAPTAAWGALAICATILLPLLAAPASARTDDAPPTAAELA
jgi:MFS family permease